VHTKVAGVTIAWPVGFRQTVNQESFPVSRPSLVAAGTALVASALGRALALGVVIGL